MPSRIANFEYDIFISYRHNDNRSGWVTEFVKVLEEELATTIKEPVSVYFDTNPHDGLLETHNVDKSLEGKLKCLIFVPIISQTYCDPKSFAWQHEFCAFNKLAKEDQLGRDIKLSNGNVTSRILPIKIHDLDVEDKATIENEIGGVLRAIDFIYKEPGVNRPLKPTDNRNENQNRTDYGNQINKVANAIKEIVQVAKNGNTSQLAFSVPYNDQPKSTWRTFPVAITAILLLVASGFYFYLNKKTEERKDTSKEILDRAEKYMEESSRFGDKRYRNSSVEAIRKVLSKDPRNERALFQLAMSLNNKDTFVYYQKKVFEINSKSIYGYLLQATTALDKDDFIEAMTILKKAEAIEPNNKYVLGMLVGVTFYFSHDYLGAWKYVKKYGQVSGKEDYEFLSQIYLELGDFAEAKRQMDLKKKVEEFSCRDIENYQRIFLCEGNFDQLEKLTDSICALNKCDECAYWTLRAKMHVGKYKEAHSQLKAAIKDNIFIKFRYPAYVLSKVGKKDSAQKIIEIEMKSDKEKLKDTAYRQNLPYYSLSAIHAMQGNYKESIRWLRQYADKGFEMGSEWYITHDPLFAELQKDNQYFADFMQIVQKAQLQKSTLREKLRELEGAK